uniref:Uncharacterized protein TCIL3000_11_9760 n=1 Tax=Trypanosoma congolense (strain IL3000) TaxID=1068625 RepID=G0V1I8_TRYCI|nr:unnamed protein product [Trypanosoma congolense IL3000]
MRWCGGMKPHNTRRCSHQRSGLPPLHSVRNAGGVRKCQAGDAYVAGLACSRKEWGGFVSQPPLYFTLFIFLLFLFIYVFTHFFLFSNITLFTILLSSCVIILFFRFRYCMPTPWAQLRAWVWVRLGSANSGMLDPCALLLFLRNRFINVAPIAMHVGLTQSAGLCTAYEYIN